MYDDHPPVPNYITSKVVVVEEDDLNASDVIELARTIGAVTEDDGVQIYHIVFSDEPRRVWDLTEAALRSDIERRRRQR